MHGGFYGWVRKNLRGRKGQGGFTLIELLVVVTILGILAAIVTLSLVGLTTHANVESCNAEYKTVQSALDSYMAANNLQVLPVNARTSTDPTQPGAQTTWTNDMTNGVSGLKTGSVPLYNASPSDTNPNYTRNGTTQFFYTWNQFGQITGIGSNAAGLTVPGCSVK
ncbi:MAG TPA: type II secretion system protein [Candidatus Dormibacteraeota bacterium]|nr:type II secretion system protein [Candidatus Dormibacteraeota bacterium]